MKSIEDCKWTGWSLWFTDECDSDNCIVKRVRNYQVTQKFGGKPCPGTNEETSPCGQVICTRKFQA